MHSRRFYRATHSVCLARYFLALNVNISILPDNSLVQQESLANAKVSARQQCLYAGPSEEMYFKLIQVTQR